MKYFTQYFIIFCIYVFYIFKTQFTSMWKKIVLLRTKEGYENKRI